MTTLVISKKSLSALWGVVAAGLGLGVCLAVFHSLTLGLCLAAVLSASVMQLSTARALASELSNSRLVPELAEFFRNLAQHRIGPAACSECGGDGYGFVRKGIGLLRIGCACACQQSGCSEYRATREGQRCHVCLRL